MNFLILITNKELKSAGFTLIEVLISLVMLSLMLLGLDVMGVYVSHQNSETWFMIAAANQMTSMIERINASENDDDVTEHVALWNLQNKQLFLRGRVNGKFPDYSITLCWDSVQQRSSCLKDNISL